MKNVLENGRGSIRVRAVWSYDKENNCIDITRIPPTTTVEAIMDKITELVKAGKIREISDMRDETDLNGLKLTKMCIRDRSTARSKCLLPGALWSLIPKPQVWIPTTTS